MFKPARLLLAMIAMVAAPAFAQNIATVNGKAIPASKVENMVKQVVAQGGQPDSPQLREMIKKELINREVLLQEADKQGFTNKPEVKAELENARQGIIISALMRDYVQKHPVSDAELKAAYDEIKAARGDKEYHARHILVKEEKEANDIIAKLKGGAKFEELAKVSQDPGSAANGGDLDWSPAGRYVKEFGDAMVALKEGTYTQAPVKSQFGYHIIKLEGVRPIKLPSLDEVKGKLSESLAQRKAGAYRDELLKKAKIQ